MVGTIIAVVLGVLAVVVYFTGARPQKPWGTPLLVLCVIGAVVAVVLQQTGLGRLGRPRIEPYRNMRLLGEGLKDAGLKDGAKIVIIRHPVDAEMMFGFPGPEGEVPPGMEDMPTVEESVAEMKKACKEQFEKGAGISVEIVGLERPSVPDEMMMGPPEMIGDAEAFSAVLRKYEGQGIDAVVSMVGLPRRLDRDMSWDLESVCIYNWGNQPMVAADLSMQYDPVKLREWFDKDMIHAVVLYPSTKVTERKVITKNNLDELPTESPLGPGGGMGPVE